MIMITPFFTEKSIQTEQMGIKNNVYVKHGCPYHLECSENLI